MSENEGKLEQNQSEEPMSFIMMTVVTGFVGGVIWSLVAYFFYMFQFTKIEPNIILEPFTVGHWRNTWIGIILSIIVYGIVSIGAALLYYALLRKVKSWWAGALYGILLFLIVFFILNPMFPSMKSWKDTDFNTIMTCVCVYILYGVFIGYSISFENSEVERANQNEDLNR
ncbi:uncharacterized BrkB/YihY/UPF0761 family membrane protein [Oikeobacillus pervagus]|uniref:Uncharacterized BrkB/YihY/UPF0761 family membrane protein n=1 Tax=Oikeobacillus pervagus TaxID=1325931 RepID=A0AAJ1WHP9_9BACI|nr:YqhR family membrane protein [Oikeobacillus pervagus]MDQ0213840.1 uncharacterized BrkB/YihY/UPF0761 family membrane protein [Oikeobacillus pervagus]